MRPTTICPLSQEIHQYVLDLPARSILFGRPAGWLVMRHISLRVTTEVTVPLICCHITPQSVQIDYNQVEGSISSRIGLMNDLELFVAAGNRISGTLPPELFHITSMYRVDLADNLLEVGMLLKHQICLIYSCLDCGYSNRDSIRLNGVIIINVVIASCLVL